MTGRELLTLKGHESGVWYVAYSPDGKRLASASIDAMVKVWDAATGKQSLTLTGHTERVLAVAFSADGKWLASAGWDKTIRIWDAGTGREYVALRGHRASIFSLAFSPDGKRLASASVDFPNPQNLGYGEIKVWDFLAEKELLSLRGDKKGIWCVAFSPDGQTLASASGDKTLVLWDALNGREMRTLEAASTGLIHGIAFSPDGKHLATVSWLGVQVESFS